MIRGLCILVISIIGHDYRLWGRTNCGAGVEWRDGSRQPGYPVSCLLLEGAGTRVHGIAGSDFDHGCRHAGDDC